MSNRDECYRSNKTWPVEHGKPVPATRVLRKVVGELRRRMVAEYKSAKVGRPSLLEIKKVREDWVEAIWRLREVQMDTRQKRRAANVLRYRPIQTLDGLDPHPSREPWAWYSNGVRAMRMVGGPL